MYGARLDTQLAYRIRPQAWIPTGKLPPEFLNPVRTDTTARILSDYRETLAELLLENFTRQWTEWAHRGGSLTRNQAHGSPGNLIDLYATVDIPECEGFGPLSVSY